MGRKRKEEPKKENNLDSKLSELEKNFGLTRNTEKKESELIYTDVFALDYVLGSGIPLCEGGAKIEFFGKESSGKTTFLLKTLAKFQKLNKTCVWVVSERFDDKWAEQMGVDTSKLLKYYPESVEDATEKILELVGNVDFIAIDSVASLVPETEMEKSMFEQTRGVQAKAYSQFCRKLYQKIAHYTTTIIWINQIREKMGVLYGNPETTPCGKALKHMADARIEFRQGKPIKEKEEKIGVEINLYGKKNKLGVAQRKSTVDFYFSDGSIDNNKSLFFAGLKTCVIDFSGKTYTYKDKKVVGKDNFIEALETKDWKKISEEVWKRIK